MGYFSYLALNQTQFIGYDGLELGKILKWNNPTPVSLAKGSWMREGAIDSSLDGVMPSHSVRVVVKHRKIAKLP